MPHQCTTCGHTFPDGSKEMLSGCPECGGNKFQFHAGEVPDEPPSDVEPPRSPETGVANAVGRAANTVRDLVGGTDGEDIEYELTSGAADPNDTLDDAAVIEDGPSHTDTLTDKEWPAVSRPDDPEDSAQADARRGFFSGDELRREDDDADDEPDLGDITIAEEQPLSEVRSDDDARASDDESEDTEPTDVPGESEGEEAETSPTPEATSPDLEDLREELNEQFESIRIVEPGQYELNLMELYEREEYIIALQENGRYVIEVPDTWRS